MQRNVSYPLINASRLLGVFLCLLITDCSKQKRSTDQWQQAPGKNQPNNPAKTTQPEITRPESSSEPVKFLVYNLKNYLTMHRYSDGKVSYKSKPEEEIQALVETILSARPDILGVCEIGQPSDLHDLQSRLEAEGLPLMHSHRVNGSDKDRALAILSRFPIVSTHVPEKQTFLIEGGRFRISRGILDTTIQLPDKELRLLGVHLKSKRPVKQADQALIRRNESLLLRQHIEDILNTKPETMLCVYGDFNDTKRSKAVSAIRGRTNSRAHMKIIELTDTRGESWTHHWKHEDIYSRIDYVMVNERLDPFIDKSSSKLLDPSDWELASDHRAMLVLIK